MFKKSIRQMDDVLLSIIFYRPQVHFFQKLRMTEEEGDRYRRG